MPKPGPRKDVFAAACVGAMLASVASYGSARA